MKTIKQMRISEVIWRYTHRKKMTIGRVWLEVIELWEALVALDWRGVKEELGDVMHFLQIWLFWRFALDSKVWFFTVPTIKKFSDRLVVWQQIYVAAGLSANIVGSTANYRRQHKVVKRLTQLGVSESMAIKAYNQVVKGVI